MIKPRVLTHDDITAVRFNQLQSVYASGESGYVLRPNSAVIDVKGLADAADILNGTAITPDHARALALLHYARESLRNDWTLPRHDLADRIDAFLTPTGPEAPHDRD